MCLASAGLYLSTWNLHYKPLISMSSTDCQSMWKEIHCVKSRYSEAYCSLHKRRSLSPYWLSLIPVKYHSAFHCLCHIQTTMWRSTWGILRNVLAFHTNDHAVAMASNFHAIDHTVAIAPCFQQGAHWLVVFFNAPPGVSELMSEKCWALKDISGREAVIKASLMNWLNIKAW